MFTSTDGVEWTSQATDMSIGNVCENRGLAYGNDIYVVLGESGAVIYSSNLENWVEAEFSQREDNDIPKAVAYGNGKFVAVGTDVFYSSNGNSWTKVDKEYAFSDIIFANNQFIAVGNDQIGTSTDGITWTVQEIETNGNCICIMQ